MDQTEIDAAQSPIGVSNHSLQTNTQTRMRMHLSSPKLELSTICIYAFPEKLVSPEETRPDKIPETSKPCKYILRFANSFTPSNSFLFKYRWTWCALHSHKQMITACSAAEINLHMKTFGTWNATWIEPLPEKAAWCTAMSCGSQQISLMATKQL